MKYTPAITGPSLASNVSFWTIEARVTASRIEKRMAAARSRISGVKCFRKLASIVSTIWRALVERVTT